MVAAEYELEHLLLEGHCFDVSSGQPPRGLQFTLGTASEPVIVDTIVMANLVGFQPKQSWNQLEEEEPFLLEHLDAAPLCRVTSS